MQRSGYLKCRTLFLATLATIFYGDFAGAVTLEAVPIGNSGNPADTRYIDSAHPNGVGSVSYSFNLGETEVTNEQYVTFLDAVARADPYRLYSTNMASDTRGGIMRSGTSGSYTYAVKAPAMSGAYTYGNKPVVFVSSGDAMRFANWLNNGQPTGAEDATTTEAGAYTLNGATSFSALVAITRNAGAQWWLPNENEWYKAAYYNPGTATYYDYATSTNTLPNNNPPSSDTGNSANYNNATGDSSYPLTDAGAYTLSRSPYGTFDQCANVWEWNETRFGTYRGIRGGSWALYPMPTYLRAKDWLEQFADTETNNFGFRVASSPAAVGDFDGNGRVDAADYIVWRKNNGSAADYDLWRAHFGQTVSGSGAIGSAAVPEPTSVSLFMVIALFLYAATRNPRTCSALGR